MFYRLLFSFLLIITVGTSCKRNIDASTDDLQVLDTIVDFSKVDVSPYFKICEKLLKEEKNKCFRLNIHKYFTQELKKLELTSKESINENIAVILLVDKKGNLSLKELHVSENITTMFPDLEASIIQIIERLPQLYPALKRGIPVTTEYNLPINIIVE